MLLKPPFFVSVYSNLLSQGWLQSFLVSLAYFESHGFPPFWGAGLSHFLFLVTVAPPHVLLQGVQLPQAPQPPSTKTTLRQRKKLHLLKFMMDIRSEKDFELGFQIKKIFFVSETSQGTVIVYHSKDTKNALTVKKYHWVEAKIWCKFVTCL